MDGDTLRLAESPQAQPVKIRLADIDTPERDQPYGREATKLLARLAYGRTLCATTITVDRYGRTVAHLYDGDEWINRQLVVAGAAWVYRKYAKPPYRKPLLEAEAAAQNADRGLWKAASPVPPWEWRRR
ncbi:MAG: thermonuclease family protein [Gammaproteobacteria bacterium]|nr:thermonuclease family protein [Gammaproteobacteria bacterium]